MTTPNAEGRGENGMWYNGTGARESDIARLEGVVRNLGNLTIRVIDKPDEVRAIVFGIKAAQLREKYPDASPADIDSTAQYEAGIFVRDMEPSARNSQDPLRLIWLESTDGSPVSLSMVREEIKFRVQPGLAQHPVTVDEVLYAASNPIDPHTLLDQEPLRVTIGV